MNYEHGHPRFYELLKAEGELHNRKNKDYAGKGDKMGNFNRTAAILALYPGFPLDKNYGVAMHWMLKQFDAAMNLMAEQREGEVEGVADRLGDVSVYAKLIRIMYEEAQAAVKSEDATKNSGGNIINEPRGEERLEDDTTYDLGIRAKQT